MIYHHLQHDVPRSTSKGAEQRNSTPSIKALASAVLERTHRGSPLKCSSIAELGAYAELPAVWAAGLRKLSSMPQPAGLSPRDWQGLTRAAFRVGLLWGQPLAALGWSTEQVFGMDPASPMWRYDTAGLARFLLRGNVTVVTSLSATIITQSSRLQRFYRTAVAPGGVPIWDLSMPPERHRG